MGTGHVMRMIALAESWRESGGDVVFLCAEVTPALLRRIQGEGFTLEKLAVLPGSREDMSATCKVVGRHNEPVAIALDGYQFDSDFQLGLKHTGCRFLMVDDYGHADAYHADVVLNQNVSAREDLYTRRDAGTNLLLGPTFALIRREFRRDSARPCVVPAKATKLLVTLGGADADNITHKVISALAGSGLEIKVAVGGSNPHLPSLRQAAEEVTKETTRVELVVDSSEMAQLMQWAEIAVAAAGSTSWELCVSALPTLFLVLADNQAANARELERLGFGLCLGRGLECDKSVLRESVLQLTENASLRSAFASRGRELVDGQGVSRVIDALNG